MAASLIVGRETCSPANDRLEAKMPSSRIPKLT